MLQPIEMVIGANGYVNQSNNYIFVYGSATVTLLDAGGRTIDVTQAPCFVPPGWTINTGTSTDILFGLSGELREFAGFLSRPLGAKVKFSMSAGVGASAGLTTKSVLSQETESFHGGSPAGAYVETETESVSHVP